ncbi:Alsin [Nymphon striatum]|nr:Alsin [Nymphon striatum]
MISEEILRPLLHNDLMSTESNCIMALKLLIGVHTELCDAAAINCFDLIQLFQEGSTVFTNNEILNIFMLGEVEEYLTLARRYINLFCDCIAVGAIFYIVKTLSAFVDQVHPVLNELYQITSTNNTKSANPADILIHLLELPCKHILNYGNYLSKLASQYKKEYPEKSMLENLSIDYLDCSTYFKNQREKAMVTQKFWESSPYKVAEYLKERERRFIKDGKSHPLTLNAASRFSSHWFILFNDVFIHSQFSGVQAYYLTTMWIDIIPDSEVHINSFSITTPEETLILSCPSPQLKTEWICALNQGIKNALSNSSQSKGHRLSPPLARYSQHTFCKAAPFKDATYTGMWLCGKLHGEGELEWPNRKKYVGKFKQNLQHGHGILTIPSDMGDSCFTVYEGEWKNGQLNGLGTVKYPNGDIYEGYFKDGMRDGHGVLKKGQFLSTAASVYIGQWTDNCRHGYGVNDDVMAGEKYLGWWENDGHHGNGVVVTIDGVYYEGSFYQNKMQGYGLVIFEDNTSYEGDLSGHCVFNGKGTLNLSNGDYIEGNFSGKWNEGVKVNGTYFKSTNNASFHSYPVKNLPKNDQHIEMPIYGPPLLICAAIGQSYAKLSVPVHKKWEDIFKQCSIMIGVAYSQFDYDLSNEVTTKAWENIAITINNWKKILKRKKHSTLKKQNIDFNLNNLDVIPKQSGLLHNSILKKTDFMEINSYSSRAFDCIYHPFGQMMDQLVDVFRATYIGVGAHPKLLIHAVEEIRSYIKRIYVLTRIIYPILPKLNEPPKVVFPDDFCHDEKEESLDEDDTSKEVVTPFSLLLPLLLPKLYSTLFMLYALDNEYSDEKYWERLLKWNKQSDIMLMTFLGVDQYSLSEVKDKFFNQSIEALQHLSTTFSPQEKLQVIHQTFNEINKTVESYLCGTVIWTMDELFPVFQFTVVRARIKHLGSEVNFIEDFMEKRLENGELGLMFTTLKACYFQIQNEKVNW